MPIFYLSPALRDCPELAERTSSLAEKESAMYYSLWQSVMDGKLKPGSKIQEDVTGEIFGISRTLVRKVLYILEQEGIVSLPPNHGAFVASPTLKEARDVLEAARLYAIHTVTTLAQGRVILTQAQKALVSKHILAQEEAENSGDFCKARRLSAEFPVLLACLCENGIIRTLYEKLSARLLIALSVHQKEPLQRPRAQFQKTLSEQIERRDEVGALTSVNVFFDSVEQELYDYSALTDVNLFEILITRKPAPAGARRGHGNKGTTEKAAVRAKKQAIK